MEAPTRSTVELVRRAQGGSGDALNRLFARLYPRVARIVRVRLGPTLRAEVDAEDLVQETFAAAVEAFDRFELRDEGALVAWLAALAERRIRDAARRQGAAKRDARRRVALEELHRALASGEIVFEPAGSLPSPSAEARADEEAALVEEELALLPTEWRELLLLRDVAGASWSTVTEELGYRTERAARFAHAKARLELAGRLRRRGL